jgi:hypothetical protein
LILLAKGLGCFLWKDTQKQRKVVTPFGFANATVAMLKKSKEESCALEKQKPADVKEENP